MQKQIQLPRVYPGINLGLWGKFYQYNDVSVVYYRPLAYFPSVQCVVSSINRVSYNLTFSPGLIYCTGSHVEYYKIKELYIL